MGKLKSLNLRSLDEIEEQADKDYEVDSLFNNLSSIKNYKAIPRSKLVKNKKNKYSISAIRSLAQSIKICGLLQPIHVCKPNNGYYTLLGGERRLTAIDMLIDDPEIPEWTENSCIPCIIADPSDLNLPISDDSKEDFLIISSNREQRKYNDADIYNEVTKWRKILSEIRENGEDVLEISDDKKIQVSGRKTREILSDLTGASRGTINRVEYIRNNAEPAIKAAVSSGKMTITAAKKKIDEKKEKKSPEEVIKPNDKKSKNTSTKYSIGIDDFMKDIKSIVDILSEGKNKEISEVKYSQYIKLIDELKSLLT